MVCTTSYTIGLPGTIGVGDAGGREEAWNITDTNLPGTRYHSSQQLYRTPPPAAKRSACAAIEKPTTALQACSNRS